MRFPLLFPLWFPWCALIFHWERPRRRAKGGLQRAALRGLRTGNLGKMRVRCHSLERP